MPGMTQAEPGPIRRFDHVGITVSDLDAATTFFVRLGLVPDGAPMTVEGTFLDTVIGMSGACTRIVMLRAPDGGTSVELSSFVRPDHLPAPRQAPVTEPGLRSIAFEVDDLHDTVERLAADGFGLVGGIGRHEDTWLMAYVRGPDAIVVALAQRLR